MGMGLETEGWGRAGAGGADSCRAVPLQNLPDSSYASILTSSLFFLRCKLRQTYWRLGLLTLVA